jgi:hypothetical protein
MHRSDEESYALNKERAEELERRRARIRELNDQFRSGGIDGMIVITGAVKELGDQALLEIAMAVQTYTKFDGGNDPNLEHDFGSIQHGHHTLFWKIDYYDRQLEFGSPDPADPAVTTRVLTIMLASEY